MRLVPAPPTPHRPLALSFLMTVAAAALLLAPSGDVFAGTLPAGYEIVPISGDRSLFSFGVSECFCGPDGELEGYSDTDSDSTTAFGPWQAETVVMGTEASQTSTIAADELSGQMDFELGYVSYNEAANEFSATFSVLAARTYAIEAEFDGFATYAHELRLVSDLGTVFEIIDGFGSYRETFELSPDRTYTLSAAAWGTFGPGASISFALVPEPSTALLVGLGLASLGAHRRRHVGSASHGWDGI